jgi:calcineurin-like phosphoesterase family protein
MNRTLTKNWNSYVRNNDEIYILGDFIFKGDSAEVDKTVKNLSGKKYLIKGNHDKFVNDSNFDMNHFEWIKDYHVLNHQNIKLVLFHYPIFEWEGFFKDSIHLYGHVHNNEKRKFELLGKRAINVGVDVNDYYPLSIERIIKMVE